MIKDANLTNRVQACDNINDKWECFHKAIADGVDFFVPVKRKSTMKTIDEKRIEEPARKKTKVWNTYLSAKSFYNWTLYDKIRYSLTNVV